MNFEIDDVEIKYTETGCGKTRFFELPAKSKAVLHDDTVIVFIGGQQSSLERIYSAAQYFSKFGKTYAYEVLGLGRLPRPDYRTATNEQIGYEIDRFITTEVKEKKIILVAASGGMFNISVMLQKNNEIGKRIVGIISIVGLVSAQTFSFSRVVMTLLKFILWIAQTRPVLWTLKTLLKSDWLVEAFARRYIREKKLTGKEAEIQEMYREFLIFQWRYNDWRTNMFTLTQYLNSSVPENPKIPIPTLSLYSKQDEYFTLENLKREIGMRYTNVTWVPLESLTHAPIYEKDPESFASFAPAAYIHSFLKTIENNS